MSQAKTCSKCAESKPLDAFYPNANGTHGRMPYCKECDNARPRKATAVKVNRMRARHRAVADLIDMYRPEFDALLAIRLAEATEEAEELAETPEAKEHFKDEPVRLRSGKRMPGQKAGDRIDVARCPHCIKHHDRGHACTECGATPQRVASSQTYVSGSKKLVSRLQSTKLPKPAPSGVRQSVRGIDPAALAEFNAGTERARRAGGAR